MQCCHWHGSCSPTPLSELLTAAVAAAAVAVTEADGFAVTCGTAWTADGSPTTAEEVGAAWGVEVGGILFSDMMPRNGSCRVGGMPRLRSLIYKSREGRQQK